MKEQKEQLKYEFVTSIDRLSVSSVHIIYFNTLIQTVKK